jgi:beta-galactosidase
VRQVAEVYLNGHRLGASKNGFVPFGFELTPFLRADGGPNVLAVMCDNRFMRDPDDEHDLVKIAAAANAAMPEDVDAIRADQIPWNNPRWHPPHGGIYRNVFLHVTDPLHISLPLYDFLRTEGPYVYAKDLSPAGADLRVEVPVENHRRGAVEATLAVEILDAAGHPVLALEGPVALPAGGHATLRLAGRIASPRGWEPDDPYLYRARLRLSAGGAQADTVTIPFGLRTVQWTPTAGFFINGHHLKLHGWGQRPTDEWPGLGAAQPDWLHFYTLGLAKEAGSNFQRWGHSAGAPVLIAAADQLGLITDQPGVDGESDTTGAAWKIRAAAWRDLLIYYRNHPSILIWEAGNQKVTAAHARELRELFERYDPHGGRVTAYRRADLTVAAFMDIGVGTEGSREIAALPVVEGEYDREESPRRIWDRASPPRFGYPEAAGQTYQLTSEEYAVNQVAQYVRKLGRPDHSGGANWIFSDTTSGGRIGVETARDSGEVDGVRLPKEAYYACAVMFCRDPAVHVIGHWTYPAGTRKNVYVVANGDAVELFVNGRSLGRVAAQDRYLFTFPDVAWVPGQLKAVAYRDGRVWATDTLHTVGPAVALRLTPRVGPGGLRADGSDVALLDVEAVDAQGARCPTFESRVDFDCVGPATWRGGWNSGRIDSINHRELDLEAGINRVAIRAGLVPGAITVGVRAPGLGAASVTLVSVPVGLQDGIAATLPPTPAVALPPEPPHFAPEVIPVAAALPATALAGRFSLRFSYSGPVTIVNLETDAQDGRNAYVDRDSPFTGLPADLRGADWVQAADRDAHYSAADLMQLTVPAATAVTVAFDQRLPRPEWLVRQFEPTGRQLDVLGQAMALFARRSARAESLTLGANADGFPGPACMYLVFIHPLH